MNTDPSPFLDESFLIRHLTARWRWIGLGALIFAVLGFLGGLFLWKTSYTSSAQIIRYEPPDSGDFVRPQKLSPHTYAGLLRSSELTYRVAAQVQPKIDPEVLSANLKVVPEHDSDVIYVMISARAPELAVKLVNTYISEAIHYTQQIQVQEAYDLNRNYFTKQISEIDGDIQKVSEQLLALPPQLTDRLARMDEEILSLNSRLHEAELLNAGGLKLIETLKEKVQSAQEEMLNLQSRYTEAHPLVIQQGSKVGILDKMLKDAETALEQQNPGAIVKLKKVVFEKRSSSDENDSPLSPTGQMSPPQRRGKVQDGNGQDYEIIRTKLQALENHRLLWLNRQREAELWAAHAPGYFRILVPANLKDVIEDGRWLKIICTTCFMAFLGALVVGGCFLIILFYSVSSQPQELVHHQIPTMNLGGVSS